MGCLIFWQCLSIILWLVFSINQMKSAVRVNASVLILKSDLWATDQNQVSTPKSPNFSWNKSSKTKVRLLNSCTSHNGKTLLRHCRALQTDKCAENKYTLKLLNSNHCIPIFFPNVDGNAFFRAYLLFWISKKCCRN